MTDEMIQHMENSGLFMSKEEFLIDKPSDYIELPQHLTECATVDIKHGYRFFVTPEPGRIGNPYFKVLNTTTFNTNNAEHPKAARFHFLDNGMEYFRDAYEEWHISDAIMKDIIEKLQLQSSSSHTIWEMLCYTWNLEYGAFCGDDGLFDIDSYFSGKYDGIYNGNPSYIPSTTKIPKDGWVYEPPLNKLSII